MSGIILTAIVVLAASFWLAAVIYLIKGWNASNTTLLPGAAPEASIPYPKTISQAEETEKAKNGQEEVEISINADISSPFDTPPPETIDPEDFYREFGEANVVRFPAEYTAPGRIKGLGTGEISVLEFAKNCYREIGFSCMNSVIAEGRHKANVFDLLTDHYAGTDDEFIAFFNSLKEKFAGRLKSIESHSDMTPLSKKTLVEKYEGMPQLIVWNKKELFLILVKSADEPLSGKEMGFIREYIIQKKLFKAKIFRVVPKGKKRDIQGTVNSGVR